MLYAVQIEVLFCKILILGYTNKTDMTIETILKRDRLLRRSRSCRAGERETEPNREMRFRGLGAQRGGGPT